MNQEAVSNGSKPLNLLSEAGSEFVPLASSANLDWAGFSLERFRLHNLETTTAAYSNYATLTMLAGNSKIRFNTVGSHFRTNKHRAGDVLVAPPGLSLSGFDHQHLDGLIVYFEPRFLERAARDFQPCGKFEMIPQPKIKDGFVGSINTLLLREVANNNPMGKLYAESLATAYAVHLIKNYSVFPLVARRADKSGLSRQQLNLVLEYIEANLAENLTVEELARFLNFSPFRLFRAFKVSMRTTLHNYVTRRRIERAQLLLAKTDSSLAEIAYTVGFSSQSHFTQIFRQAVNLTPLQYRRVFRR